MSLLRELQKHVPSAEHILNEADCIPPYSLEKTDFLWSRLDSIDFVCVYGLSALFYGRAREWLDGNPKRRLVFVEEDPGALARLLDEDDAILLLNDLRVKIYFLETPLQIEPIAKKVGWQAVFLNMTIVLLNESGRGVEFAKELEKCQGAAHLLLSDASDWGVSLIRNARSNQTPFRSGLKLRGAFQGIPAVIVGAGPSLEKNGRLLSSLEHKALLFAGGSALNVLNIEPHFAASIDREAPYRQFKIHPFSQTPFCYQARMNPDNFSLIHAEALLFPDGNSPAINWLQGEEDLFDGGWTVGNFLTRLALLMGCNPILFVGMDLCYQKGRKYAHLDSPVPEGLVETTDREGRKVWTQRDWLMAARWTEEVARNHPTRVFIDATEGGIGFKSPIQTLSLSQAATQFMDREWDLRGQVHASIQTLPLLSSSDRWEKWNQSLRNCSAICENIGSFQIELIEEEIVYQKLLSPLWPVWKPVFERELELDPERLSHSQKMGLNQILFFQQVLQEHLSE